MGYVPVTRRKGLYLSMWSMFFYNGCSNAASVEPVAGLDNVLRTSLWSHTVNHELS